MNVSNKQTMTTCWTLMRQKAAFWELLPKDIRNEKPRNCMRYLFQFSSFYVSKLLLSAVGTAASCVITMATINGKVWQSYQTLTFDLGNGNGTPLRPLTDRSFFGHIS